MLRRICWLALAAAVPAQAQAPWNHAASGATLPGTFDGLAIVERRDLDPAFDSVVNYEAPAGLESTTVYVFRASVPNARLWFDRALATVARDIPMALFDAGAVERVAAFGSATPNALRQVFVARQAGRFRSTALVVAQSGPWLVKVRATSATLDRAGLSARLDRHLNAIRIAAPAFPAALDSPPMCKHKVGGGQAPALPVDATLTAEAAAAALVAFAGMHAPAADLCRFPPSPTFSMLGSSTRPTAWTMLVGDAGRAIGVLPVAPAAGRARHFAFASTPAALGVIGGYDGQPVPRDVTAAAAPILRDPGRGLVAIGTTRE